MIGRILFKLIVACTLGAALFVACVVGAVCCALQSPSFYADLVAREIESDAAEAARQRLEQARGEFLAWHAQTKATRHAQLPGSEMPGRADAHESNVHTIQINEADLNALFAAEESRFGGDELSAPRIAFDERRVRLACALATPAGRVVLSAAFVPQPPTDDQVRMEIVGASVGRLPLPLAALSRWLPKQVDRLSGDLYLDTNGRLPQLVLLMNETSGPDIAPTAIECAHGVLSVEWTAAPPIPR